MNDSSHPPPDQKPPPPTLFQYIEENHKLITTLGVFTALTLFSRQITNGIFANLLSVLSLTLSLIVWLELSGRFPSKMGTYRLYWFESVLGFTVMPLPSTGFSVRDRSSHGSHWCSHSLAPPPSYLPSPNDAICSIAYSRHVRVSARHFAMFLESSFSP